MPVAVTPPSHFLAVGQCRLTVYPPLNYLNLKKKTNQRDTEYEEKRKLIQNDQHWQLCAFVLSLIPLQVRCTLTNELSAFANTVCKTETYTSNVHYQSILKMVEQLAVSKSK